MKGLLMVQGTASSVGKSLLCGAFCRILREDGYSVAPFKSQNMALNSFVTRDGLEMGRAQVMQAEAAGIEPLVEMNPILLKPTSDQGSQVIVMGRSVGNMQAMAYFDWKESLLPVIDQAFHKLSSQHDLIVIEGAGSPAEINLKDNDLVNMGLALRLNAPVLLVGDIDRGGVFASLYGTIALLEEKERAMVKGVIINKFRGDPLVLEPGLRQLEALIKKPVLGVVPMINLNLDDEDSVTDRFKKSTKGDILNVQVIALPRISNFTDFNPLELFEGVKLSYAREPAEFDAPDLLILPGSKNTIEDLMHLRQSGWEEIIKKYVADGGLLVGICGGFQMLGRKILDPLGVESAYQSVPGFGFIDMETLMEAEKTTIQVEAIWHYDNDHYLAGMEGQELLKGYEIHMGRTFFGKVTHPLSIPADGRQEGAVNDGGNVFGTYLHGIFDNLKWTGQLINSLRIRRGLQRQTFQLPASYREFKEQEYGKLAALVRHNLNMDEVYRIIKAGA